MMVGALLCLIAPPGRATPREFRDQLASLEQDLEINQPGTGTTEHLDLGEALRKLNIPSVSIAVIENGEVIWAGA